MNYRGELVVEALSQKMKSDFCLRTTTDGRKVSRVSESFPTFWQILTPIFSDVASIIVFEFPNGKEKTYKFLEHSNLDECAQDILDAYEKQEADRIADKIIEDTFGLRR